MKTVQLHTQKVFQQPTVMMILIPLAKTPFLLVQVNIHQLLLYLCRRL